MDSHTPVSTSIRLIVHLIYLLICILLILKLVVKLTTGWCSSNLCLVGKTAIVTGANTGIGYETAQDFAKRGAKVTLACRDLKRGQDAEERIRATTNNFDVYFKQLDLSSFKSIRKFTEDIINSEKRLDILVNNAGAGVASSEKSEDGLLLGMQINYFGPFLLTNLLLDLIKNTENSRIINVSSILASTSLFFNVKSLNRAPRGFVKDLALYARSKLCNILFTIELAERLKETSVTTYSLHPGVVHTEIYRRIPRFARFVWLLTLSVFFKNAIEGAQTTVYCSVAKGIETFSGQHFEDCHVVKRYKTARDPDLPKQLWMVSEDLVKLNKK